MTSVFQINNLSRTGLVVDGVHLTVASHDVIAVNVVERRVVVIVIMVAAPVDFSSAGKAVVGVQRLVVSKIHTDVSQRVRFRFEIECIRCINRQVRPASARHIVFHNAFDRVNRFLTKQLL